MSEERITYDEFMTMFKFAPRMCYTLYDKAEDEIERLNNIINDIEKYIKENSIYYNTSDGCQWVDQFKVLDKLKELKENNNGK